MRRAAGPKAKTPAGTIDHDDPRVYVAGRRLNK
jgi:hypothetical protein